MPNPEIRYTRELLLESVKQGKTAILTHKNPDGDGFCAALMLQEILHNFGCQADIVLEKEILPIYDYLEGHQRSREYYDHMMYRNIIILDCHEKTRIGKCAPLLFTAKNVIAIDHHIKQDTIGKAHTYIDTNEVSTGSILFRMFENDIKTLPAESQLYVANTVYTTILNDTDNFINANTDAETFRICSELIKYGLVPGDITEKFLYNKSPEYMRFVGEILASIDTWENGKILFITSTIDMLKRNKLGQDENSKITRFVKGTKGVLCTIFLQEVNKDRYRISLRSNHINVNKIAVKFGGGGHIKASGCEMRDNEANLKKIFVEEIKEQF